MTYGEEAISSNSLWKLIHDGQVLVLLLKAGDPGRPLCAISVDEWQLRWGHPKLTWIPRNSIRNQRR